MGKRRISYREYPPIITKERTMFFRILDILASDDTTDEQRLRIYEAAEKIAAEPPKPDNLDTPEDDNPEA
jgi:hypothetical protein